MTTNPILLGLGHQQTPFQSRGLPRADLTTKPFQVWTSSIDLETVQKQISPEHGFLYSLLTQEWTALESVGEPVNTNINFLRLRLANASPLIREAITIDARVMHGNPVFAGTRVPVYQVIEELADGTAIQELPECFPGVSAEKIQAGLDFAVRLLRVYDD
jgi:uncharacterized protein (DUF433 family)